MLYTFIILLLDLLRKQYVMGLDVLLLVLAHFSPFLYACSIWSDIVDFSGPRWKLEKLFEVGQGHLPFFIAGVNMLGLSLNLLDLLGKFNLLLRWGLVKIYAFLHHVLYQIHILLALIFLGSKFIVILFVLITGYGVHYILQVVVQKKVETYITHLLLK